MSLHNKKILPNLYKKLPEGVVASSAWLEGAGYSRQLVYKYVHSHWLDKLGRGAYMRAGSILSWQGVVVGLQKLLTLNVHVGGLSALNLQGLSHYLPLAGESSIHLFGVKKLPAWVSVLPLEQEFELHTKVLFDETTKELGFQQLETKIRDWTIRVSSPERAIFEVLYDVEKKGISFQHASELFEGLVNLRPKLINSLLKSCKSDRTRRLFLFLASYHQHQWFKKISSEDLIGKSKMQIVKGGRFDNKYRITVPENFLITEAY